MKLVFIFIGVSQRIDAQLLLKTWTRVSISNANIVQARNGSSGTFVPQTNEFLVFGGTPNGKELRVDAINDLYTMSFASAPLKWTAVIDTLKITPQARFYAASSFDSLRGDFYIHGGKNSSFVYNDFWKFSATASVRQWTQIVRSPSGPSSRFGHCMAYDQPRDRLFLSGGTDGSQTNMEVWTFDIQNSWSQVSYSSGPGVRSFHSCTVATSGEYIIYSGARVTNLIINNFQFIVWKLTGTVFTQITYSADSRVGTSMVYDPLTDSVLIFLGFSANLGTYSAGSVRQILLGNSPTSMNDLVTQGMSTGRSSFASGFNPQTGELLVFSGFDGTANLNDLWSMQISPPRPSSSHSSGTSPTPVTSNLISTTRPSSTLTTWSSTISSARDSVVKSDNNTSTSTSTNQVNAKIVSTTQVNRASSILEIIVSYPMYMQIIIYLSFALILLGIFICAFSCAYKRTHLRRTVSLEDDEAQSRWKPQLRKKEEPPKSSITEILPDSADTEYLSPSVSNNDRPTLQVMNLANSSANRKNSSTENGSKTSTNSTSVSSGSGNSQTNNTSMTIGDVSGISIPGYIEFHFTRDLQIIKKLGKGGFGDILLAESSVSNMKKYGQRVIVKKSNRPSLTDVEVQSFLQEVSIMEFFKQERNIATILGFTRSPYAIVLKYYPQKSLTRWIKVSSGIISKSIVVSFMRDIAQGLKVLHSKGVVHNDIKPDNVLIDTDPVSKRPFCVLTDFGISQIVTTDILTVKQFVPAVLKGMSYSYASPERFQFIRKPTVVSSEVVLAGDIYAFAITLWEMLIRRQSFK